MSKNHLGVEAVDAISIIAPDPDPENTQALQLVSDGFGILLKNALYERDIELRQRDVLVPKFQPRKDLPTDAILLFSVRPDQRLKDTLIYLLSSKRFHLLQMFVAERLDAHWLHSAIIKPHSILLTQQDLDAIQLASTELFFSEEDTERMADDLAQKLMLKKAYDDDPD